MRKAIAAAVCVLTVLSAAGCAQQGVQLENVDTNNVLTTDQVNMKDYQNNLAGLEEYLVKLQYIPDKTEPTKMMYSVIGAVAGDRYIFNVNNSGVLIELYEYEPDKLNEDAKRVLNEVKENGAFHVFGIESIDGNVTYPATLSDNEKYLMIYTDNNNSEDNQNQKKRVTEAVKAFEGSTVKEASGSDTSKTEESKAESSKAETSAKEASKAETSKTETSKTEASKTEESKPEESKTDAATTEASSNA